MKYIKKYQTTSEYNVDGEFKQTFPHIFYIEEGNILRCEAEGDTNIAFSENSNPELYQIALANGWIDQGATAMTVGECAFVKSFDGIDFSPLNSFNEFEYFTGINEISAGTFEGCSSLMSIVLPPTIETIGDMAFKGCTSIFEIVLPKSVGEIGEQAFFNCSSLVTVVCENDEVPPVIGESVFPSVFSTDDSHHIYVPVGCVEMYKGTYGWSDYENTISEMPEGEMIGDEVK